MREGYEHTYRQVAPRLLACDLAEAAARLGFDAPVDSAVRARFLGRAYHISRDGVAAADGGESDPVARSLLVYYITSGGGGEPAGSYSLPGRFSAGVFGGGSLAWMTDPLARRCQGHESLLGPLARLDARFLGARKAGEYVWVCPVLPKLPVQLVYRAADEEFPAEIQLMPDDGAGRFLEFEQLAFLCGALAGAVGAGLAADVP